MHMWERGEFLGSNVGLNIWFQMHDYNVTDHFYTHLFPFISLHYMWKY